MNKIVGILIFIVSILNANNINSEQKEKEIYPLAKILLNGKCKKEELNSFSVSTFMKNYCEKMTKKEYTYLKIYLDDIKKLKLNKNEKCPVCGMLVYKYPNWATKAFFEKDNTIYHYSFDGPKDMFIYMFVPKFHLKKNEKLRKVLVTDYYSHEVIDGKKAYYVIGSDIFGPMGKEIVPFEHKKDARSFLKDHGGNEILNFEEISKKTLCKISKRICQE